MCSNFDDIRTLDFPLVLVPKSFRHDLQSDRNQQNNDADVVDLPDEREKIRRDIEREEEVEDCEPWENLRENRRALVLRERSPEEEKMCEASEHKKEYIRIRPP